MQQIQLKAQKLFIHKKKIWNAWCSGVIAPGKEKVKEGQEKKLFLSFGLLLLLVIAITFISGLRPSQNVPTNNTMIINAIRMEYNYSQCLDDQAVFNQNNEGHKFVRHQQCICPSFQHMFKISENYSQHFRQKVEVC